MQTRRDFVSNSSSALGGAWVARFLPFAAFVQACATDARLSGTFITFSEREAADFDAFAARIVPTDDTPGAREAGVIWFMDAWLGGGGSDMVEALTEGASELDEIAGGHGQFAQLGFEEQTSALKRIETSGFFNDVRLLTIAGMFAMPKHGGNRDKAGWKLVGFRDQHAWQSPFGHYDARAGEVGEEESA